MPSYKLTYFNLTGLGEPIRLLLSYGGQEFEDKRITREEWKEYKPTTPMGQMPILEIDDKKLYQSIPIVRFLGKQFGVAGQDDWENLEIDMIAATIDDLRITLVRPMFEPNEEVKARLKNAALNESLPFYCQRLDKIAEKNNGYLALGRLTWVDFILAGYIKFLQHAAGKDITADYPNLKAVVDHVFSHDGVKNYLANRPKSPF